MPNSILSRYGIAVGATALGVGAKLLFGATILPGPFVLPFAVVLFSAWYGGLGPALVATGLSAAADNFLFFAPVGWLHLNSNPAGVRLVLSVIFAVLVTRLAAARRASQRQLAEREELYRSIVLSAKDYAIMMLGTDGRVRSWNTGAERIKGYRADEIIGRHFSCFYLADDVERGKPEEVLRLATAEGRHEEEIRCVRKDGSIFWANIVVTALRDRRGDVIGFSRITRDISERKRNEQALLAARDDLERGVAERTSALAEMNAQLQRRLAERTQMKQALERAHAELERRVEERTAELLVTNRILQQEVAHRMRTEETLSEREARLRFLIGRIPGFIWTTDTHLRLTLGMGRGVEPAYVEGDVLGHDIAEFEGADPESAHIAAHQQALAGHTADYEQQWEGRFYTAHVEPLRNAAGTIIGVIGVAFDITGRKQDQQELEQVNTRLFGLLESITAGFAATDKDERFTYVNRGAEQMFHKTRAEMIGQRVWSVFPEAVDSPFYTQYYKVKTEQTPVEAEAYYPPTNRWIRARAYPAQGGVSSLFENITERHAQDAVTLSDVWRALNAELNVPQAFPTIAAALRTITGCEHCSVAVFDGDREWLTSLGVEHTGLPALEQRRLRVAESPAARDILAGRPYVVADLSTELSFPVPRLLYDLGCRSRASLPLRGREQVVGMLTLAWCRQDGLNPALLPVLNQVAEAIALALEKSRLFEEVRVGHKRLRALSQRLMEVQEEERRHIARELHDEIGQNLTGLKFAVDALGHVPVPAASKVLIEAGHLVDELVTRVRDLSLELRPGMLDDLGLLPAVLWLLGRYTVQTHVHVSFEHGGLDRQRFGNAVETAAYRIIQEALTNVARHAHTPRVTVRAWAEIDALVLQIGDMGSGFDLDDALNARVTGGLSGMRERAALLGGQLLIESAPGQGTRVSARLPLQVSGEGAG